MTVPFTLNGLTFNTQPSTPVPVRTNRHPNPFAVGLSGWTTTGPAATLAEAVADGVRGAEATVTSGSGTSIVWSSATAVMPVVAGESLPVTVRARRSTAGNVQVQCEWRTDGGAVSYSPTDWRAVSAGTVTEITTTLTVPAGITSARVVVSAQSATTGLAFFVGGIMVGATGTPFDGATTSTGNLTYSWTGTPYASASVESRLVPDPLAPRYTGTLPLGTSASRYAAGARVQAHGQWSTTAYREALAFDVSGIVRLPSTVEIPAAIGELDAAFSLSPAPLTVHWPSGDQTIMVHRDGALDVQAVSDRVLTYGGQVVADDPTWYAGGAPVPIGPGYPLPPSGDVQSASTGLPSTSGGMSFPFSFPFAFDATVTSGDLSITTARGGWWVFTVAATGPLVNPRIIVTDATGAQSLLAWTITMSSGESLIVDPQRRTSMLQGTASRPPSVRQWPSLSGGTTAVQFRADSGAGTLTVRYVSAA